MNRKMTYKKLMAGVEEGNLEINAWAHDEDGDWADVTFYKPNGDVRKREHVLVIGCLKEEEE